MEIQLEVHLTSDRGRSRHQGSFPVKISDFKKDPDYTAAVAAIEFIHHIRAQASGFAQADVEQVIYNGEQDITELVKETDPNAADFDDLPF